MSELFKRVQNFARPASTVKHSCRIIHVVTRDKIEELNRSITPKLEQNARQRKASWKDAKNKIVK